MFSHRVHGDGGLVFQHPIEELVDFGVDLRAAKAVAPAFHYVQQCGDSRFFEGIEKDTGFVG